MTSRNLAARMFANAEISARKSLGDVPQEIVNVYVLGFMESYLASILDKLPANEYYKILENESGR